MDKSQRHRTNVDETARSVQCRREIQIRKLQRLARDALNIATAEKLLAFFGYSGAAAGIAYFT